MYKLISSIIKSNDFPMRLAGSRADRFDKTTKIKPNQLIVTTGAQTLLSEELRHQIKNENED